MYTRIVTITLLTMTAGFRVAAASKLPDPANRANVTAKYLQLPLTFEMNEGQSDPQVKALARGSGYGLFLTSTESVFVVAPGKDQAVVRVRAVGANPDAKVTGMDRLSSTSNYFVGNDKSKWRKNVAQYARVKYDSIYPGVDLVYYGNQRQLEYDYVVAPGADPNSIQFAVDGARKLHIERNGDLRLDTRQGALYQHKPVIYQQIDGARREIAGNFILRGDRVSFRVGEYDRGKELVIDPSLVFLTYLGGSGTDSGKSIAITSDTGVTLVAGSTSSANFPIVSVAGVTSYPYTNETDGFLAVLNPAGTKLFNSTYVGGSGGVNTVTSVAVDNFEVPRFLYVAGYTTSTSFDVVNPAQATYGGGGADGWVAQLVLDLTVISFMPVDYTLTTTVGFCTYLGGSGTDEITGIAIEQLTKDVFVTGYTTSTNFPVTSGVVQKTNAGGQDAFVARYASGCSDTDNGLDGCTVETTAPGKLIFSTYLGGTGTDTANGIAIYDNPTTGSTNAYIVGTTTSTALPAVAHAGVESNVTPAVSDSSAFLVSMSGHGTTTYFSNIIGSSTTTTQGNAVTTDAAGNIYITGNTNDSTLTTVAPIFKHYQGDTDGFVGAYGSGGTAHFFTYFGGAGYDVPYGIGVFSITSGSTTTTNLFIAGQTNGSYYITTGAPQSVYGGGTSDGFVSMMTNTSGSTKWTIGYSTYMGGPGADVIYGLSVGTSGNARVTGLTNSTTGMATTGAFQTTIGGGYDAFVAEIQTTP